MLDEVYENESRSYNLIQANKQLTLLAEYIEVRNIVSTASKRFDGKIKKDLRRGNMLAGLARAGLPGCAAASYCSDMKLVDIESNTMLSPNRIAIVLCFSI